VNRPPPPRPAPVPVTRPALVASNPGAEAAYRSRLQALIAARKQYPRMAEKEEAEGVVSVAFVVLPNGTITGARIARSAGNQWLDQAALQAVRAASGALPFPADIHKSQWSFTINVNFALE
jgi:protein TonB